MFNEHWQVHQPYVIYNKNATRNQFVTSGTFQHIDNIIPPNLTYFRAIVSKKIGKIGFFFVNDILIPIWNFCIISREWYVPKIITKKIFKIFKLNAMKPVHFGPLNRALAMADMERSRGNFSITMILL